MLLVCFYLMLGDTEARFFGTYIYAFDLALELDRDPDLGVFDYPPPKRGTGELLVDSAPTF